MFLHILGQQTQKRGEREAQVAREGKGAVFALFPLRATHASRTPCLPKTRKTITPVLQARSATTFPDGELKFQDLELGDSC